MTVNMRRGIIIFVLLAVVPVVVIVVLHMQAIENVSSADYQPAPAFAPEDQQFVREAYDALVLAADMDETAIQDAHHEAVVEFARAAVAEDNKMRHKLRRTVAAINGDFRFEPSASSPGKSKPGVGFDRRYLQSFIQRQERQISIL